MKAVWIILAGLLILGFQNCAKAPQYVATNDEDVSSLSLANALGIDEADGANVKDAAIAEYNVVALYNPNGNCPVNDYEANIQPAQCKSPLTQISSKLSMKLKVFSNSRVQLSGNCVLENAAVYLKGLNSNGISIQTNRIITDGISNIVCESNYPEAMGAINDFINANEIRFGNSFIFNGGVGGSILWGTEKQGFLVLSRARACDLPGTPPCPMLPPAAK